LWDDGELEEKKSREDAAGSCAAAGILMFKPRLVPHCWGKDTLSCPSLV